MKVDHKIVGMLVKVAETSGERHKLACAVVYKKRILAIEINSSKTDPFQGKYANHEDRIYKHAEISAIKRVQNKFGIKVLRHCNLYIVRIKKEKRKSKEWIYGLAKPCSGCMSAIHAFGIKKIIFTDDIGVVEEKVERTPPSKYVI